MRRCLLVVAGLAMSGCCGDYWPRRGFSGDWSAWREFTARGWATVVDDSFGHDRVVRGRR